LSFAVQTPEPLGHKSSFHEKHMTEQKPPQISPYLFPFGLFCFGLWFFYDGWISTNPDMQEHLMFNRIGSAILLPWALIDFFRTHKSEKEYKARKMASTTESDV
jgi:hypothetical protein